jgi:RNA polymerase-associated protein
MMTLYSGTTCPFSHRCRIVFHEKPMDFKVIDVDILGSPADIAAVNPYNRVPVLVERDLVLYEANIINEYIEERFPHPPLMPLDPQNKARARQLLSTVEQELYSHIRALEKNLKSAEDTRAHLRDRLIELSGLFSKQKYMLGDTFSMPDVALAPLLWRLDHYGIELPKKVVEPLLTYAQRVFSRQGFIDALTPTEKMMRR